MSSTFTLALLAALVAGVAGAFCRDKKMELQFNLGALAFYALVAAFTVPEQTSYFTQFLLLFMGLYIGPFYISSTYLSAASWTRRNVARMAKLRGKNKEADLIADQTLPPEK